MFKVQTMDDNKLKARKSKNNVVSLTRNSASACLDYHKFLSSMHTRKTKLICSGCKKELVVPTKTNTYRCYECNSVSNSISGYKQSGENNGGAKLFNQDQQLHNAITNVANSLSLSSYPTTTGNKRAVLCGVTYRKRRYKLSGTINDVINMKSLLVNNFAFPIQSIRVLTEEQKDPNLFPTKRNIMESLKWLVKDCRSGDSLVFYFSGHGLQQAAQHKEDETDGLDETICPVDFIREGMITDNEINSTIVGPLKKGVRLHAIIDACHSGTSLDLIGNWKWVDNKPPGTEPDTKCKNGGLAICFSACEDGQMAADTAAFGGNEMNGVMTYLLTKIIRENSGITYAGLLEKLHEEIAKIHRIKHFNGFLRHIFHRRIEQDPLLSSSEKFDVHTRISF
ncbi:metacaspase-3-like isoform X2 [Cicer arietinum]|uniref:Metacaspase-1-like isoform X2 n=1 Tax=Cicer arietinum TaxID=3827 RepID=A0A1S3DZV1_CICAR|nr:metacaspase-1-like isoform X2 [Cicer arietinum]